MKIATAVGECFSVLCTEHTSLESRRIHMEIGTTNCTSGVFQLQEMSFSVAGNPCMARMVIVRWACLPTSVCSTHPIFSSLHLHTSRGADVSPGTFSTRCVSNLIRFVSVSFDSLAPFDSNHY